MPYIEQGLRDWLKTQEAGHATGKGQLNYQLTQACINYIKEKKLCYDICDEIMDAFASIELCGQFGQYAGRSAGSIEQRLQNICVAYCQKYPNRSILGTLRCCAAEFYRRVVAPYEDKKIADNGDVYHLTSEQTIKNKMSGGS